MLEKYRIANVNISKPVHEHDCSNCTYVGSYNVVSIYSEEINQHFDIYYCFAKSNNLTMVSLIARWGKDSHYYSYAHFESDFNEALEYLEKQWTKHDYYPTKLASFAWLKFIEDHPQFKK